MWMGCDFTARDGVLSAGNCAAMALYEA